MADRSGGRLFSDNPLVLAKFNTVEGQRRTFHSLGHAIGVTARPARVDKVSGHTTVLPPFELQIAAILLHTIATHILGHLIGVAATPPHASMQLQATRQAHSYLMLLTVKVVVVVVVPIDVDVLDCAQSCDGAATAARYMRMWSWRYSQRNNK